jgi:hypothetical protein
VTLFVTIIEAKGLDSGNGDSTVDESANHALANFFSLAMVDAPKSARLPDLARRFAFELFVFLAIGFGS